MNTFCRGSQPPYFDRHNRQTRGSRGAKVDGVYNFAGPANNQSIGGQQESSTHSLISPSHRPAITRKHVEFIPLANAQSDTIYCDISDEKIKDNAENSSAFRFRTPRMSLLGKPLQKVRPNRRDVSYRKVQSRVYNFLERPRGYKSVTYHVFM